MMRSLLNTLDVIQSGRASTLTVQVVNYIVLMMRGDANKIPLLPEFHPFLKWQV